MTTDDEDFLHLVTDSLSANPFRDIPDAECIVRVPVVADADHVAALVDEIRELRADNEVLAQRRRSAIADAGRITRDLNRAIANLRQTERWLGAMALVALAGWVLALLLIALGH